MPRPKMGSEMSNRCIIVRARRVLLLRRSEHNKRGVGKYEFPGGKIDDHLEIKAENLREVSEETGFTVRLHQQLGWRVSHDVSGQRIKPTPHLTLYWLARIESGKLALSSEHDHAIWCTYKEALALGDDLSPRTTDFLKLHRTTLKKFGLSME